MTASWFLRYQKYDCLSMFCFTPHYVTLLFNLPIRQIYKKMAQPKPAKAGGILKLH